MRKNEILPNLIIIGAQKCATTSLHYYLNHHPQISMAQEKELNFFIREFNWHKGVEWYKSNFSGSALIYGESSPDYTNFPFYDGVPGRMHSILPDVKLIYILRDPIERIISHYVHKYAAGREDRKIEEALKNLSNNAYITRSKYYMQLEQYLEYFNESKILIISLEDLHRQNRITLQKIFKFLNVDKTFYSSKFNNLKHESNQKRRKTKTGMFLKRIYEMSIFRKLPLNLRWKIGWAFSIPFSKKVHRPVLNENLRKVLIDCLKDDVNRLRIYTGCEFEYWSL